MKKSSDMIKVINNFDIADIKHNLSDLILQISMPYDETGVNKQDKGFEKRAVVSFLFSILLTVAIAISMKIRNILETKSIILVFFSCLAVSFMVFFAVWEPHIDRKITKSNRMWLEELINQSDSLAEITKIISEIEIRFEKYYITKRNLPHDLSEFKLLKQQIDTFLLIQKSHILQTDIIGNSVIFDIENEKHEVSKIHINTEKVESTIVDETCLIFKNWEAYPKLIIKYQKE